MRCGSKYYFLTLIVLLSEKLSSSSGLTLNQNGGYSVILAVKNDEPEPVDVEIYIKNIETTFRKLTERMWTATKGTFHIANLDIVLPASWELEETTGDTKIWGKVRWNNFLYVNFTCTYKKDGIIHRESIYFVLPRLSYVTADIRISTGCTFPYVANPNLCGQPGDFMELPKILFDSTDTGKFGETDKVLLVEWARYRWGAYEEHGFPGDLRFPYFTRDFEASENEPKWIPNGCTNADDNKLLGVYRNLDKTECDPTSETRIDPQCRFYPEQAGNSEVTSSLMNYHFLQSVQEFCDNSTHQRLVPTKQNLYCDYKSVMETIESSPDFKVVQSKTEKVPDINFRNLSAAPKPALYLLFDSGLADTNDMELIDQVMLTLVSYFASGKCGFQPDTIIGAGQMPAEENGPFFQQLVPLGFLKENRRKIIDAINHRTYQRYDHLDFGMALQQTAATIRATSPSEGGNILFVKTTGAQNSSTFPPEKELELALRRENIKLFAIEIVGSNKGRQNLAGIAAATEGDAIFLSFDEDNERSNSEIITEWLDEIVLKEYETLPDTDHLERITFSQDVVPNLQYTFQIYERTQNITFLLSTPGKVDVKDIIAGVISPIIIISVDFTEGRDYGANRYVYTGFWDTSSYQTLSKVSFNYSGIENGHLTVLADGENLPDDISVQVRTSASENLVDLGNLQNPEAPFVIIGKVSQNGSPVIGANVTARVQLGSELIHHIQLVDSHPGLDNFVGDGIYSEIMLFPRDGVYTVSVTVTNENSTEINSMTVRSSGILPPDQDFEDIPTVPCPLGVTKMTVLGNTITVINADKFIPVIPRVRDLSVAVKSNAESEVTFSFTAPRFLDLDNFLAPESYRFFVSELPELLIDLDVAGPPDGVEEAFDLEGGGKPGTIVFVEFIYNNTIPIYFVVVGLHIEISSVASNIVEVRPEFFETTPPSTTQSTTDSTTEEETTDTTTTGNSTDDPSISTPTDETSSTIGSTTDESSGPDPSDTTEDPEGSTSKTEDPGKGSSSPPTSPEPDLEESNKPWVKTTAGILTIILIVFVCLAAAGGGYWYVNKRRHGSRRNLFGSSEA